MKGGREGLVSVSLCCTLQCSQADNALKTSIAVALPTLVVALAVCHRAYAMGVILFVSSRSSSSSNERA